MISRLKHFINNNVKLFLKGISTFKEMNANVCKFKLHLH